jgi:hypothetical protein
MSGYLLYRVWDLMPEKRLPIEAMGDEIFIDRTGKVFRNLLPAVTGWQPVLDVIFVESGTGREHELLSQYPMTSPSPTRLLRGVVFGDLIAAPERKDVPVYRNEPIPEEIADDTRWHWLPGMVSVAICMPHEQSDSGLRDDVSRRTAWRAFAPEVLSTDVLKMAKTSYVGAVEVCDSRPNWISAGRMPRSAIELNCYDAVVLLEGMDKLDSRQQQALQNWVRAGGRLVLSAPESALSQIQQWLRECGLVEAAAIDQLADVQRVRLDLGRILWLPPGYSPGEDREIISLPTDAELLPYWSGSPDRPLHFYPPQHAEHVEWLWSLPDLALLSLQKFEWGLPANLVDELSLRGSEALPVAGIIGAALVCLLAATPLDYFVFGLLRRRIWCWFVFPLVLIAATWFLVDRTNRRSSAETTSVQQVVVLGEGDRPLRQISFQFYVPPTHGEMTLQLENARFHEIGHDFTAESLAGKRNRGGDASALHQYIGRAPGWKFEGDYPRRYIARRKVAQWHPVFIRIEHIAPDIKVPPLNFDQMNTPELWDDEIDSHIDGRFSLQVLRRLNDGHASVRQISQRDMLVRMTIESEPNRSVAYVRLLRRPETPDEAASDERGNDE